MVKAPARWPSRPKSPCRATVEAPGGRAGILAQGQVGEAACRQTWGRCCAPARKLAFGEHRGHDLRVRVFVAGMANAGTGPRSTPKMLPIPNSCRPSVVSDRQSARRDGPAQLSHINFRGTFRFNVERYADVLVERAAERG